MRFKYRSQGVQSQSFADWAKRNNRTIVDGKSIRAEVLERKVSAPKVSAPDLSFLDYPVASNCKGVE